MERFWSKVDKNGPVITENSQHPEIIGTRCWLWMACRNDRGYGQFHYQGRTVLSHRRSWFMEYGEIDENLDCLHKCDTPACQNPVHMWQGPATENAQDMLAKGRDRHGVTGPISPAVGERSGRAKLKAAQVLEIRAQHANGVGAVELAKTYSVSDTHIGYIVNRKSWKHI